MIELNCETDFVEQHENFINFSKKILLILKKQKIQDLNVLNNIFENERIKLISQFQENILIRKMYILNGPMITSYIHRNRIGVLLSSNITNVKLVKYIAMHIASNNPEFLSKKDIPISFIKSEKKIQYDIALNSGKSNIISERIANGKLKKKISNMCLLEQNFIMDLKVKIKNFMKKNNIIIHKFIRFEVGL